MADGVLAAFRLTGAQRLRQRAPVRRDVDAEVLEFAADVARLAAVEVEGRLDGVGRHRFENALGCLLWVKLRTIRCVYIILLLPP